MDGKGPGEMALGGWNGGDSEWTKDQGDSSRFLELLGISTGVKMMGRN